MVWQYISAVHIRSLEGHASVLLADEDFREDSVISTQRELVKPELVFHTLRSEFALSYSRK